MFLEKPRNSSDVGGRVKQSQQAISDDSITITIKDTNTNTNIDTGTIKNHEGSANTRERSDLLRIFVEQIAKI